MPRRLFVKVSDINGAPLGVMELPYNGLPKRGEVDEQTLEVMSNSAIPLPVLKLQVHVEEST